ncbi:hypothetical protein PIB30_001469 [Stylosanthes scabra]|uniref:Uncharacterized protein n=1 Tax=Stylosanthes scabra TaxID=79078 RepID=A0ABU6Q3N7_9FABA|nr:hypothetical protein [Stylosanthes scabra]
MDKMFFIRLYPNGVTHRQKDGICFQCQAHVVFQHPRVSTLQELRQVMLYKLGGQFMEITEVGYRFLSSLRRNRRPIWMLVWLLNDKHVRVSFECHRRLTAETIIEFLVVQAEAGNLSVPQPSDLTEPPAHATPLCIQEPAGKGLEAEIGSSEADSDYFVESGSSSEDPNCDKLEDVPCFYQQLDLDAMRISDPLRAGIIDDYNTDGGVESRVGHRLRNWEAVHMAVKKYSIRRNAEYRVVESD